MGRVDGGLTSSCPQRHLHLPLLRHKVFLLIVAVTAAHYAGAIPHEKAILSWGDATVRHGWRRFQMLVHHTQWNLPRVTNKAMALWSNTSSSYQGHSVTASASARARTPDPASLAPPCSLKRLNEEYRKILLSHRRQASPNAPAVEFDPELFQGCYRWNQTLERKDTLRHDPDQPWAEIAGMSTALVRGDAPSLARYIWSQFDASPQHAAIQADPSLTRVAVTATSHYFLVRLKPGK